MLITLFVRDENNDNVALMTCKEEDKYSALKYVVTLP